MKEVGRGKKVEDEGMASRKEGQQRGMKVKEGRKGKGERGRNMGRKEGILEGRNTGRKEY